MCDHMGTQVRLGDGTDGGARRTQQKKERMQDLGTGGAQEAGTVVGRERVGPGEAGHSGVGHYLTQRKKLVSIQVAVNEK